MDKMAAFALKVAFLIIVMCTFLCRTHAQRSSHWKEELIQDTVRKFLGVKSDERSVVPGRSQSIPPRYMMDLYEKYRSGQTPMQGNTVRSILAMRDKVDNVDMLIFNLTGLKPTEQILQSKLYLLKRRKPKSGKKREHSTFRLNIGCFPNMTSKHQIDISLSRQKPEWHSYDISGSVVSCRQTKKGKDSLLGLTLEIKRSKGNHRLIAFKRLIKPNSQPFVLIFSEDSQNQTVSVQASTVQEGYGEIGDLLRARANEDGFLPTGLRLPESSDRRHRHRGRRSSEYKKFNTFVNVNKEDYKTASQSSELELHLESPDKYFKAVSGSFNFSKAEPSDIIRLLHNAIEKTRNFLNVYKHLYHVYKTGLLTTNPTHRGTDIPSEAVLIQNQHYISTTSETFQKVLLSAQEQNGDSLNEIKTLTFTKKIRRSIADTLRYSTEEREFNNSEATMKTIQVIDENFIHKQGASLYPKARRRSRKRKMHEAPRRHKKKRRRNRKLPFWWTRHDSKLHAQDLKQMCQRKSLTVDFSQLGWDDWIISPKSFNAHYCEGSCTFPIIKHTETSNHAAVQSLIHAMGLNVSVPTPCCVPSETSSLTLLYFDENGSLVLKNYPNMIVEKCGCR